MKSVNFVLALAAVITLLISLTSAHSPLQDFCVATNTTTSVYVNGRLCKDPKLVTANDFFFHGQLTTPRTPTPPFGSATTSSVVDQIPGLNNLYLALGRVDYAPNGGQMPPHTHPRASEILVVLEGTLYVGFVTSDPDNKLFSKVLRSGDVFVFPMGLIHFQVNVGKTPAASFSFLNSHNPGVVTVANAVFGSNPSIDANALARAFLLDVAVVKDLQTKFKAIN